MEKDTCGLGKPTSDLTLKSHYLCQPVIWELENKVDRIKNRKERCINFNISLVVALYIHKKATKIASK